MQLKYVAIIVAGGSGNRMNASLPKQFLLLNGRPVLMHTIESFYESELRPEIIVVLNTDYTETWSELCIKYSFNIPHKIAPNGKQRFDSVKNALTLVSDEAIVAVHDAVRPIIYDELITRCFKIAKNDGAVIPVVVSRDSIRKIVGEQNFALNREEIYLVQTPQVFRSQIIKKAYQQDFSSTFTDDASVVENSGVKISTTEGDYRNLKITFSEDLAIAEILMQKKIRRLPD